MRTITINGTKYPVHFGMRAVNTFLKRTGKTLSEIVTARDVISSLDGIVALASNGLTEGARKEYGREDAGEFSEEEVWDFIDEQPELIFEFVDAFAEEIRPMMERMEGYGPNQQAGK